MYRVELSPGEETAFRTIEELAVAIKRGVVTPRARIWHNVSAKWLPIEFHPHYKAAASMQLTPADLVAGPPVQKLELLTLGELMDPPAPPVRSAVQPPVRAAVQPPVQPAMQPEPAAQPPRVNRAPEPESQPRKKVRARSRTKSGRRTTRIALAGTLLLGGAQLVYSAASTPLAEDALVPFIHRRLVSTAPNSVIEGRPETTAAAVMPGLPTVSRPAFRSAPSARPGPSASGPTETSVRDEVPSLESRSEAATPPLGAFRAESDSGIQPAPSSIDIAAPAPSTSDSLARKMVDSTGKKALKRILRTIGGTPTAEPTSSK